MPRSDREPARVQRWLFHVLSCDSPASPTLTACHLDARAEVAIGRADVAGGTVTRAGGFHLGFADHWMSARHAQIERRIGGYWIVDRGSKNGVVLNGQRIDAALLADGDWIEVGHTVLRFRHGPPPAGAQGGDGEPVALQTALPALQAQSRALEDLARSQVSIVLRGETGTGKEVLARAVHQLSGRPGPLVAVNCGALAATLLESELFGYRKGAFSNALEDRPGLVRAADRGTLFLDEIGDLPLSSQAALLRVLQEHEVTPVGGTRPLKVDLRVVCATHRDLEAQVARSELRADLYARLSGHTFVIPPLRERREDLGLLLAALLQRLAPGRELHLELDAARALCCHDWPLNVRELEKRLASAIVLAREGGITAEHLALGAIHAPAAEDIRMRLGEPGVDRRAQLIAALRSHRGNVSAVARELGKARTQIQRWIRSLQIDPEQFRGPSR
jgi:DNA-binding NtrC family response regulator